MRTAGKSLALIGGSGIGTFVGGVIGAVIGMVSRPASTMQNPGDYLHGIPDMAATDLHILIFAAGGGFMGFGAGLFLALRSVGSILGGQGTDATPGGNRGPGPDPPDGPKKSSFPEI